MKLSRDIVDNYNFSDDSGNSVHLDNSTHINNPFSWSPYFVYKRFKENNTDNYLVIYIGIKDYLKNFIPYEKFPVYIAFLKNAKKPTETWWYCKDYVSNPRYKENTNILEENKLIELIPITDEAKGHFDSGRIHISELFDWKDDINEKLKEILKKFKS